MAISVAGQQLIKESSMDAALRTVKQETDTQPERRISQVDEVSNRQSIKPAEIENLVVQANNLIGGVKDAHLEFKTNEGSVDYPAVVQVVDTRTEEIIKEIPPEHMQKAVENLQAVSGYLESPGSSVGTILDEFV